MGFLCAIGAAIGAVVSAVSSFASSVGGVLGSMCKALCPIIKLVVDTISSIVSSVAKALGIVEEKEEPEELGMKAELCDKKPEDFDNYNDYINEVRKVPLDPEKVASLKPEDKAKYRTIGTGIEMIAISEKYQMEVPLGFWVGVAKAGLQGTEAKVLLDNFKEVGQVTELDRYFTGDLSKEKMIKTDQALENTFKELDSKMSSGDLDKKFDEIAEKFKAFKEEV